MNRVKDINYFGRELEIYEDLIREYLKYGSVDKVYEINPDIPISIAQAHRAVNEWGIVKAAGPNSKLSEIVYFFTRLAEENVPIEALYKKMPIRFTTSVETLHRIYRYVKEGVTRRIVTALVISEEIDKNKILIAEDVSTPRPELGKRYGGLTIPMCFSKKGESAISAIARVLQQEVFTELTVKRKFPYQVIEKESKPFIGLTFADIKINVFIVTLPNELCDKKFFTSGKLINHRFENLSKLIRRNEDDVRIGIKEIWRAYEGYLKGDLAKIESAVEFRSALKENLHSNLAKRTT